MTQTFNGVHKQKFGSAVLKEARKIVSLIPTYTKTEVVYKLPKALRKKTFAVKDCVFCLMMKYDATQTKLDLIDASIDGQLTLYPNRIKKHLKKNVEISQELDNIVRDMKIDGLSEMEKAMAVVKKVLEYFQYCTERNNKGELVHSSTSSYDIVFKKCGICSGYAKLFCMLCDKIGLTSRYLENTEHAWNQVKVDGRWLYVDCTWDDNPVGLLYWSLATKHDFYNVKKHPMHKTWDWDCWMFKGV